MRNGFLSFKNILHTWQMILLTLRQTVCAAAPGFTFSPQPCFSLLFSTNERPDLSSCWADYVVNHRGRSSTDPLVSHLHPFVLAREVEQNRKVFLRHAINRKQVNPSLQFFTCIKSSGCTVGERHKRICPTAKACRIFWWSILSLS